MNSLGRVFKQLRGEMSQEELGYNLGYSQSRISKFEKNGTNHLSDVKVYAEFYEMKVSEILRMAEENDAVR